MKHVVLGLAVVAMSGAVFAMPPLAQDSSFCTDCLGVTRLICLPDSAHTVSPKGSSSSTLLPRLASVASPSCSGNGRIHDVARDPHRPQSQYRTIRTTQTPTLNCFVLHA